MSYLLHSVDLFVFDVNTTVRPLRVAESQAVSDPFRFLVLPDSYRHYYETSQSISTSTLHTRSLPLRERRYNRFWQAYMKAIRQDDGASDYWKLQMPFVCRPSHDDIRVDEPPLNCQASAVASVYLTALGWSNNLRIRLYGTFEPPELVAYIGRLRGKDTPCLLINGEAKTLSELFQYFSQRIREEVFQPDNPPDAVLRHRRHVVVSISQYEGSPNGDIADTGSTGVTETDQALIASLLYGRPISAADAAYLDVTLTHFDGPNFAVTDFEAGTSLFMHELAHNATPRERRTLLCLASNLRHFSRIVLSLLSFYDIAAPEAVPYSKVQSLHENIPTILRQLSYYYQNHLCRTFFNKHSRLKRLIRRNDAAIERTRRAERRDAVSPAN